ncbi:hypothetical protein [Streptomyces sp. NPDC097610]|uniref:hypothetical protein n=1 Tax=Streptomyces sp. NPDC097610 TaxID=3157227 RepID=UPI0033216823
MRIKKPLAVLFSAAALALGLGTTAAPSASADGGTSLLERSRELGGGCWYSGSHWWCNNRAGAPVYGYKDLARYYPDSSRIVGHMYSNPSWFECRYDGGNPDEYVGGPHPYRWEWTEADNGQYGWMKDTAIGSETNTLPACW